jgi:hypothetical protein
MPDLPEDIDAIPWSQLQDAYGPSGKTPGHLQRLMSPNAGEREDAVDELIFTLCHQGSVYEASLYAIAPLAAMLKRKDLPDPAVILQLLHLMGTGGGWHTAHQGFTIVQQAFPAEKRSHEIVRESQLVRDIHDALSRSVDLFVGLLRAPAERTRMESGNLLTIFPERAESFRGPLREVLDHDSSMEVRANTLIVAERLLGERLKGVPQQMFRGTDHPVLKTAAAIRWGFQSGRESPPEAVEWLAGIVETRAEEMWRRYGELPASSDFWLDAANVFALAGARASLRVLPHYIDMLKRFRASSAIATGLLLIALAHGEKAPDLKPESLTPEQKKAILAVAHATWPEPQSTHVNMGHVLRRFGLPDRHEEIDQLLGLPNADHPGFAGPRDRAIAEWQKKNKR